MKRLLALMLTLALLLTALPCVYAEEDDAPTQTNVSDADLRALDEEDETEKAEWVPLGPIVPEPVLADYNVSSPAIYTATLTANHSLFAETYKTAADSNSTPRVMIAQGYNLKVDVLAVGQSWAIVRTGKKIGYVKRDFIDNVTPVDKNATPPYGTQKATYIATTNTATAVHKSMSNEDESWMVLTPGTLVSIWQLKDGWAVVPYWRTFGYINMNELTNLIPVSPTDQPIRSDSPIAAYTSYYNMAQTPINLGRINNINVACRRLTRVMKPGEELNFNKDVGPFKKSIGYAEAPVLVNGTTKPGFGGGTCQVSSTLYNALLQLPQVLVQYRRPHGPAGAKYLPHGVDAAVGGELNLRFRNNYVFPIRIEGHTRDDGALTVVIYRAD